MNNGEKIRIKQLINLGYLYLMKLKASSNLSRFITSIHSTHSISTQGRTELAECATPLSIDPERYGQSRTGQSANTEIIILRINQ